MNAYIYKSPEGGYVVLSGKGWPYGKIEDCPFTLWGARRVAKRLAKKSPKTEYKFIDCYADEANKVGT
jgi:hypothetical protein